MKAWTNQEEQIVVDCVKNNPHNIKQSFKDATKKIDRSSDAISFRYYSILRQKKDIFDLVSSKSKGRRNTKNIPVKSSYLKGVYIQDLNKVFTLKDNTIDSLPKECQQYSFKIVDIK